jgi:hypothetical protein
MKPTKKLIAILILSAATFGSYTTLAQKTASTVVNSEQLFNLFQEDESTSTRVRFCHDFNVTIDLQFMEIETTITICCAEEIYGCIPVPGTRVKNDQGEYPNDLEINNSSTVTQGRYNISIVDGRYTLNKKGEIIDLKYKVIQYK